jgi:Tubulin-tyrosine ligase family
VEKRLEEEKKIIEADPVMKDIKERYPFQRNIWIVKPGENTNRGHGIEVCSDLNEIRNIVMNGPGTI